MPRYVSRYRRRSSRNIRRSKNIPLIIGICMMVLLAIGLVVLAATLVGLGLKGEADKHDDANDIPYIIPEIQIFEPAGDVREVNGYVFSFNKNASTYIAQGVVDLSVMLRSPEGDIAYNSAVASKVGWDSIKESVELKEEVSSIHKSGGYLCSYMYINAFSDESELALVIKEYEKQLVIEAAGSGIDEILLLGIDVKSDNLNDVLRFLSEIKSQSGNCKIGIELDYDEIVSNDIDSYIAQKMLRVCDFVTLDATSVPCMENADTMELDTADTEKAFAYAIEEIYYYTSKMQVRLTFHKDEVELYRSIADSTYLNRQMHE